ncbi:MAG TPA: phosphogluconate dehydratase, partial [Geminicoccaceae bacterium]
MTTVHPRVAEVTARVVARSAESRAAYLAHIRAAASRGPRRGKLACGNLAHGFAACGPSDKEDLKAGAKANVAIVSAYNDMLSAHQPLQAYPDLIKAAVREAGGVAQFAGGVPAMCDGVTQGQAGMELSLFSRDVIALSTAVALSHDMFDGALYLGVCDKIVPGLLMGALSFGHLPAIFVPAGPMTTGLPNDEKARVRQLYAEGKVGRDALLEAESKSYHGPGTCTFYGTANSNQMLMEVMGLHMPGAAFVNPGTPLRQALTGAVGKRICEITALGNDHTPVGEVVDERAVVNAVVGVHATGGSTNHTIHLIAIARAAGIRLALEDFAELSEIVPLLCRIYPNGMADVNQFHAAGGIGFLIRELLDAGLLHEDVRTAAGGEAGLRAYAAEPWLDEGRLAWRDPPATSLDPAILRPASEPFLANGGLKLLEAESKSYHGPGTCTFYGTANSNQMLMEVMGLHMPGAAFVNPGTPLRQALTGAAGRRVCEITALGNDFTPVGEVVDERAVVNAVVGVHATGGSTNHTIHLIAIARAAGIRLALEDFAELSDVVPLLCRIYPNG